MNKTLLVLLFFGGCFTQAQTTWSEDVAEIFYDNCVVCHRPNGIGPFSLLNYSTAETYKVLIKAEVETGNMPPWKADTTFQHYFDEKTLTTEERSSIINWVNEGAPEGDASLAPPQPVFSGQKILPGAPDLSITMPKYMSKATVNNDDYICISLPTEGILSEKKIKAIEILPGNSSTVHHCLIYYDKDGNYITDTIGGDCGGPRNLPLMAGYTPGARPTIFPGNDDFSAGMIMKPGSSIILAMHYPHGSYGTWDATTVNFYFYDEPLPNNFRQIYAAPVNSKWDFTIPANEVDTLYHDFDKVDANLTVLSVFPHMHLLGSQIESYGVTPAEDTVNFVKVPHYDFDWQDFYWFRYLQPIPSGTVIKSRAIYDNTTGNIHNPYDPPRDISAGLNTTDEMYLIYYHFMGYQSGDEFINQDSLNTAFLSNKTKKEVIKSNVNVFPNPFTKTTTIDFDASQNALTSLYIYDINGRIINKLVDREYLSGPQQIIWKGDNRKGNNVVSGVYFYSMTINNKTYSGRILKE